MIFNRRMFDFIRPGEEIGLNAILVGIAKFSLDSLKIS